MAVLKFTTFLDFSFLKFGTTFYEEFYEKSKLFMTYFKFFLKLYYIIEICDVELFGSKMAAL